MPEVLLGGEARRLRRRFQMIFQDPFASLNARWRVNDIIAEPLVVFEKSMDAGANASVLPIFNTASLVGFGAVVAASP